MAHCGEIVGEHYPGDSKPRRILARQFVNMLFKNEKFIRDFERVKGEWEKEGRSFGDKG
jgi:acid phosphatase (class A)